MDGEYIPRPRPGRPYGEVAFDDAPIYLVADDETIQKITDAIIFITDHGSPEQKRAWSKVRKELAAAAAAEAKRDGVQGQLIERALVEKSVFGYLDALSSGASELAKRVPTKLKTLGSSEGEAKHEVQKWMGDLIRSAQDRTRQELNNAD